jgi:hypothetical protein
VQVLRKIAGYGSLTTTQRYVHPDQRSITDAGDALTAQARTTGPASGQLGDPGTGPDPAAGVISRFPDPAVFPELRIFSLAVHDFR